MLRDLGATRGRWDHSTQGGNSSTAPRGMKVCGSPRAAPIPRMALPAPAGIGSFTETPCREGKPRHGSTRARGVVMCCRAKCQKQKKRKRKGKKKKKHQRKHSAEAPQPHSPRCGFEVEKEKKKNHDDKCFFRCFSHPVICRHHAAIPAAVWQSNPAFLVGLGKCAQMLEKR